MFDLKALSTSDLILLAQTVAIVGGFYFSWRTLKAAADAFGLSTKNAQAELFNQMIVQGRDLQYKFMELFIPGNTASDQAQRQKMYLGTLIGYYASCFELRSVLELPDQTRKLLDADLRELMREKQVRDKWEEVKPLHSQAFIKYVEDNRGIQ
ncbi:hypothetical protein [Candidatus Accumulibacter sp. ACC007]|uniref:hypothetical protein n=1 Tax=Candidatus Accumulibacter sp. ACC007 TaxID=2823333 RepID=UPI0025BCB3E5|nr:hypothetical protein [Candidatus Accumulibacter sp. ACC007]